MKASYFDPDVDSALHEHETRFLFQEMGDKFYTKSM